MPQAFAIYRQGPDGLVMDPACLFVGSAEEALKTAKRAGHPAPIVGPYPLADWQVTAQQTKQ